MPFTGNRLESSSRTFLCRSAQLLHDGGDDYRLAAPAFRELLAATSAADILGRRREHHSLFAAVLALDQEERAPLLWNRLSFLLHSVISAFLSLMPFLINSLLHSLHFKRKVAFFVVFAVLINSGNFCPP